MQADLREVSGEFEQVMLASLVPHSLFSLGIERASDGENEAAFGSDCAAELFPQVFAAALERAGGLGLRTEFFHLLQERT